MLALPAFPATSSRPLSYETINYKGWKNSIALQAGPYRVVVVPSIGGRVMEYSLYGQNPIWTNPQLHGKVQPLDLKTWWNYGGYKTWPAPQSKWSWPPDPMLDAATATVLPWKKQRRLYGLHIIGKNSLKAGIAFEKWLRLDPRTGHLTVRQVMRAGSGNKTPLRWGLWDITQVRADGLVVAPLDSRSRHKGLIHFYDPSAKASRQWTASDGLLLVRNREEVAKYGVETDKGWMAWFSGNLAYIKRYPRMLPKYEYPDQYSTAQIYTNGKDLPYTEMEVAGPLVTLRPEASTALDEEWRLVRLPAPVNTDQEAAAAVRRLSRAGHLQPLKAGVELPVSVRAGTAARKR